MAPQPFASRKPVVTLGLTAGAAALAWLLGQLGFVQGIERSSYDQRVAWTAPIAAPSSPVVVVEINESSIRGLEPIAGRWPWPRAIHAVALDYLAKSGAKVVVFDIGFFEREGRSESIINGQPIAGRESDRAFVDAVERAGNVVLLAEATFEGTTSNTGPADAIELPGVTYAPGAGFEARPTLQLPFDELGRAAKGVGHNYLVRDGGSTDIARLMRPFVDVGGVAVPALGMAGALAFLDVPASDVRLDAGQLRIGERALPLLADPVAALDGTLRPSRQSIIQYRRPQVVNDVRSTYPSYSFFDVLLSADQQAEGKVPAIPPSTFSGKLVFIGTSAAGTFDRYQTPFDGGVAGVELHAMLADGVISGVSVRRAHPAVNVAITIATALGAAAAAVYLPLAGAMAASATLMAGLVGGVTWLLWRGGVWAALVVPGLATALALFGGVAWQYFVEGKQKREIKRLFGRYVSKDVIEQLMANPALASLGGERRRMTVLFSDIRGFTSASERGTPEDVVAQLNEYFGAMVDVLFRHRGTLDKFVGDMVMGLFGAPIEDAEHADHAVAAALEMVETLGTLNAKWQAEGKPTLDIGIGINTGEMIAGNVGAEAIMSYTVIGDAVNLGARLESLNKDYGTRILASEATRSALTRPVQSRPIGEVVVKGKTQSVLVHEIIGRQA